MARGIIRVNVAGDRELANALRNMGYQLRMDVARDVEATAQQARGEIMRRIMRGPKTGKVYKRGGVTHQASAPGEAPASDTGRLANSVQIKRVSDKRATVGSRLAYALYLEMGTDNIRARPVWRPVARKAADWLETRLRASVARNTS